MTESENVLDQFKEDFALLVEAGLLAVHQKDEPTAKKLFHAAHILKPEDPAPDVGMGYIALNKLEVKKAISRFTAILNEFPDHTLAKAFLGIAYLIKNSTREEGEKLLKEAMDQADDDTIVKLGEVSLEWAEKDLKAKRAPFFSMKSKDDSKES